MRVLMVLTSHDKLGDTGRKTGFWLEELAAPYYVFKDAGAQITLASPKGGRPPLDPKSQDPNFQTDITRRFEKDAEAEGQLDKTVRLDGVKQQDYDTVFYPGGHGPMWDLAEDPNSIKLIESFLAAGKTIALVCHGRAGEEPFAHRQDGGRQLCQTDPRRAADEACRRRHRLCRSEYHGPSHRRRRRRSRWSWRQGKPRLRIPSAGRPDCRTARGKTAKFLPLPCPLS